MKSSPLLLLFLIVVFFLGMHVYASGKLENYLEPMETVGSPEQSANNASSSCPTMLVKQGNVLMLYDSKQPESESNPLPFYSLDEYMNYIEIQKKKGIICPVLFLQQENDTQGNDVYRVHPSPLEMQQGGSSVVSLPPNTISQQMQNPLPILDATRDSPPYNQGNYAGFDPIGLNMGQYTVLDKIHDSTQASPISENPADSNWGGRRYSQQAIDKGLYEENNVYPPVLINANKMIPPIYWVIL